MHKYREFRHHRVFFRSTFFRVLITLIIMFFCVQNILAQDLPGDNGGDSSTEKDNTDETPEKTEAEKAKEKEDELKAAKQKELAEMKKSVLEAKDASARTIVLNSLLMKASTDADYRNLIKSEILVDTLDKGVLREILEAIAALGKNSSDLLLSEYVTNLIILRINPDFQERIDIIIKSYPHDRLFLSIDIILRGVKKITSNNLYIIKLATVMASSEEFFSVRYQLRFIEPLINLLNVKENVEDPDKNRKNNGIKKDLYEFVHKYSKDALIAITSFIPEQNDFAGWSLWFKDFKTKPEIDQLAILLENLRRNYSEKSKKLAVLQEKNLIQKLKLNAKSYEINVEELSDSSTNVILVALENIIAIVIDGTFDEKNRDNLLIKLNKAWFADDSLDVKKSITDLYLKLGGCEAKLRTLISVEVGIEIRRYIVERLSFEGKDGASLDKLIQIIREREGYPAEIQKAAIKGLGKWNNYLDERNIQVVIETLMTIITLKDDECLEAITLANTINELASKFDIKELIVHLFEVKPFKPQQLVVLLWSALRSGKSPELESWLIDYEKKSKYLVSILRDSESFVDLITTVFELFEIMKEPFIEPTTYSELYDALSQLYLNIPEGANGLFSQKLERALIKLALPYDSKRKFADLSDERKKIIEKSALIVPELLMKRNLADFVLEKLLPAYPSELSQLKQVELEILKVRVGLRTQAWDQLDIFSAYKTLIEQDKILEAKIREDIAWTIALSSEADVRIAPRLIFAVQSVNAKYLEFTWKTVLEYVEEQTKKLKIPAGEIYFFKINKMINSLDSLKKLAANPTNKYFQSLMKLLDNAEVSFEKWFMEIETSWVKFTELNDDALKFALTGENYRVVLNNLVERLAKLQINDAEAGVIWKFIDVISTDKNLTLPRFAEAIPKDDFIKRFKELKTRVDSLTLK